MARLNIDNFPAELKQRMSGWGDQQEPKWSLTRLVITLCQEWEDHLEEFEKRNRIRKSGGNGKTSNKEIKIEALRRRFEGELAKIEAEEG